MRDCGIVYSRTILFRRDRSCESCYLYCHGVLYESLLRNHAIPALQQHACVGSTIFKQDGAPPHITNLVKRFLSVHYGNGRIVSCYFLTNWPPRSPDLNPCDF
ncbi:hypothetical protein AVEN_136620-1 [Araneus ventricosus]|uniref:Tc1-like transposase DDE domain-containing protein n=1 Tax=Araneus ventricosus TaxID=182803 RepID=A0A4Y2C9E1_ARAVE|nr:hypothetical protein AVEN_136620-1 [Araneus ventricosus]